MKKSTLFLSIFAISITLIQFVNAQTTAAQTVSISVGSVYKMAVSGSPAAMNITTGTAGTDALTPVTDNSTTYSITQNNGNTIKITAGLSTALSAGYTLKLTMASTKGTSAGAVNLSTTAASVVTAIANGADAAQMITYSFAANASAGTLTSTNETVTLTLTP
jgi:hypothetical protein